jgi:hypothetical protein
VIKFPESAAFGKKIPLAQLKEKGVSPKFLKWVKSVKWAYKLSPSTLNLSATPDVKEIEVLEVVLRSEGESLRNRALAIEVLGAMIPNPCLFRLFNEDGDFIEEAICPKASGGALLGDSPIYRLCRGFGETDETVNLRAKSAIASGLTAIICVGETLEMRESGITAEIVAIQTKKALAGISKEDLAKVIIAYEPVWAIGTGKVATTEQANEVCAIIRDVVAGLYDKASADELTIQYGGSMNAANAADLLAMSDVDGGLIGGASLKVADFTTIVKAAQ